MRQHTIHTPYLIGEVHCYSAEINGELVLFDSGPPTAEALALLVSQIDLSRLKYLFITHCHIDHYGLAAMIATHNMDLAARMDRRVTLREGKIVEMDILADPERLNRIDLSALGS